MKKNKKIYTNKSLLSDCVDLLEAYMTGSISLKALDNNAEDLIEDIKFKYPNIKDFINCSFESIDQAYNDSEVWADNQQVKG